MDSLVVVLIILASSFEYSSNNKFHDEFIKADSAFNEKYKFNIYEMKKDSDEAAKSALYKTINELYDAFGYKRDD